MVILTEASSSSSPPTYDHKYAVFLSFRGADTRLGFTNHLYTALMDASLITFLDDEEIQTGESLKPELENARKASSASVVVLSENYASSTWCLDELVLILEQKRYSNQIVIPIFFHVDPAHIRKQLGSFGEAMEEHRLKMEAKTNVDERSLWAEKMEIWRKTNYLPHHIFRCYIWFLCEFHRHRVLPLVADLSPLTRFSLIQNIKLS